MGPWLRLRSEDVVHLSQRTIHMNPECSLITRGTFRLDLCYCVDKLHRCFHYEVDNNFCLHASSRCSENVDIATGQNWPAVVMRRRCCPFPECLRESGSVAKAAPPLKILRGFHCDHPFPPSLLCCFWSWVGSLLDLTVVVRKYVPFLSCK